MSEDTCEEKVFKSIFYQHLEEIRNFIYYKSGNLAAAEDLAQEAFVKLWHNCRQVPIHKARSYLYAVARNAFLNEVAHQKVKLKFEHQSQDAKDHQTPQFLLEEEEFKKRLEQAIANLPEGQRLVFLMNRIDKKKYKEIAEELDISVKAVEKRMHKALSALRKIHKKV